VIENGCQDELSAGARERTQPNLDGELAPVFSTAIQIPPGSHGADFRRGKKAVAVDRQLSARSFRHEQFHRLTNQFCPGVSEELFHLGVDQGDHAVLTHHEHSGRRRLDHLPEARVGSASLGTLEEQPADQQGLDNAN